MIVDTNVINSTLHPMLTGTLPLNAFPNSPAQQQQQQPPPQSTLLSLNGVAESVSCLNALSSPPSEQSCSRSSSVERASHSGKGDDDDDGDDDDGAANNISVSSVWVEVPEQRVIMSMESSGGSQEKRTEEEEAEERSCCYDADDMEDQRAEHKIVDIPYSVLLSIYQSLDADKGWEKLAAETGYTFDKIRLLELEGSRCQGSPSRSLLWELGSRNITIRQLYGYLNTLSRYREMNILEDYVHNPSKPSFENNGLRGLPDVRHGTSSSLKGLKSPLSKKSNSSSGNNSSSINFNQQVVNSDVNISMKCQQTDKYYPGKQMPFLSPPSTTSNSAATGNEAPKNPSSIMAPTMKPANPGSQVMTGSSSVKLVQNMIKQMPGGASGSRPLSSSSSARAQSQYQTTTSASSPSSSSTPHTDSTFPSSVSSLAGLESSFDVHMALIGSACFSYSEVVQATNCFSEQNKLGEGAFGTVYFGVLRKNKCAVKKMAEADGQDAVVERSTQRELTSLLKFRHENIVTLYGYAVDGASLCLIYQFMPNGSLEDRMMCKGNTPPLVWSQRLNIMLGSCQGLNFLHTMGEQPLIHGDIKSANILLDKHMEAKIGDLGQAQQANGREGGSTTSRLTHITRAQATTKVYGTRAYQPQEVQTGSRPSTKSDVFAMGVVLLEIFSGEKAFDERREGEKFLAEDFRSLKGESGDEACLNKLDRRGGECPREVCLKILNIADVCTSHLKRHRPDSIQLLQKMTELDELYTRKTGIKHAGTDSLPGSEHSCHLSHSSSPAASMPNLSGAPPRNDNPQPPRGAAAAPTNDINVNRDQPSEKHFAMHLHLEKPDNCCMVNKNLGPSPSPQSPSVSRQHSQSPPSSSCRSPIDYFQKGQALPPAFRLQQAYDSQSERERKRISRLSQCPSTKQREQHAESTGTLVLPQSDPAKLAALEQFDRENLHGLGEEKESNSFQSDPKKLAALKQFDEQGYHVHGQGGHIHSQEQMPLLENNLASDPAKLAQLRLFDDSNMKTLDDRPSHRMEGGVLDSDPRKLAALTRFDAVNSSPHALSAMSSATDSDPRKLAALTQFDAANCAEPLAHVPGHPANMKSMQTGAERNLCAQEPFPVSELDYVVNSQREALEACTSSGHQPQQAVPPETFSLSASHRSDSAVATASVTDTCPAELRVTSATSQMNVPAQIAAPSSLLSGDTLLRRQQNFFDMYNRALEEIDDEEDFCDENAEFENGNVQESENQRYAGNAVQAISAGEVCSPAAQAQVVATRIDGHCHPIPTEQDESLLNYFKQRQQHYEKTFNKPQVSPC